ncbi:MAG TPA: M50 family metallopeptidase [Verrucomicrobiae bacterium]|nr:M50 family metallopeptidase [Verrucomicrobiae bacterium]
MSILLLIVGILLFVGLVVIHEWGHFIAARRNGVEVEEFGIFFPPRLYARKMKAGWLFTINAVPLGGFVRLKGEHDTDTGKGTFGSASVWAKTKIMGAGVFMNLLVALVLFTIIGLIGMPQIVDNQFTLKSKPAVARDESQDGSSDQKVPVDQHLVSSKILISYVEPGSPAAKAGLQSQDELDDIGLPDYSPVSVESSEKLPDITKRFAGQEVIVYYTRAGQSHQARAKLLTTKEVDASKKTDNPKGYLGIVPNDFTLQRSTWSAPIVAAGLSAQLTGLTFQGLGHALGGLGSLVAGAVTGNNTARQHGQTAASDQVSGPVGIFFILKSGSLIGYQFMLFIIAYISLTLAIMNILPIPALDGGRLWLTLISRGLKKPLSPQREEIINATGFAVLIGLVILITVVDVKRFF